MRAVRVLYFASTSLKSGGSLHSLVDLVSYLQRHGRIIPFVVLPDHGTAEELLISAGIQYSVLRNYGSEWPLRKPKTIRSRLSHFRQRIENLKAISETCRVVRDRRIDLIHINTSVNEIGYYVAKRTKTPFVWHVREFIEDGLGLEFYNPKCVYRHMSRAEAVIAISSQLKKHYETLLSKNVALIHNGVDTERFYYAGHKPDGDPLIVTMVGRVSRLKGHYDVVDAIAACHSLPIRLVIVGTRDMDFEEYAKQKGVLDRIVFTGYQDDVRPWLRSSHVFIAGHPWEGFGRATVEAMLAGCCVIGVQNAGTVDLIEDSETGFLYQLGDTSGLRKAIQKAFEQRSLVTTVGENARRTAMSRFNLEKYGNAVLHLYWSLLQ